MVSSEKPVLVYWGVHGRSDFCQAMMAAGNIDYDLGRWPGISSFGIKVVVDVSCSHHGLTEIRASMDAPIDKNRLF